MLVELCPRDATAAFRIANVAWIAYGALWGVNIIDAVVNGRDYSTVDTDQLSLSVAPAPGGVRLGLSLPF